MALRNQPYIPLYVQDYLTDEKLNSCSASSQGVYIKIMCIFHKLEDYGTLLLKQKDKQSDKQIINFALRFAKLLPFDNDTMMNALTELVDEGVLTIEGDKIYQKRMVKDFKISQERSKAGKTGGGNPDLYKQNPKQTPKQNTENESEDENKDSSSSLVLSSSESLKILSLNHEELKKDFLNSESWIVTLIRNNPKIKDIDTVKKHMVEFCKILSDANQYPITYREASNRFSGYLAKQINGNNYNQPDRKSKEKSYIL